MVGGVDLQAQRNGRPHQTPHKPPHFPKGKPPKLVHRHEFVSKIRGSKYEGFPGGGLPRRHEHVSNNVSNSCNNANMIPQYPLSSNSPNIV